MLSTKAKNYIEDYLTILDLSIELISNDSSSFDTLKKLMKAHLYKIPFDGSNFTLHKSKKMQLKNREILNGFMQGKGSICYQSHGAFRKLLSLLGFNATLVTATMFRFGRDEPKPYAQKGHDVHSAIIVVIENVEYLVDLVWGNAFREPLKIGGDTTNLPGEDLRRCIKENQLYQLQVYFDEKWETEYQFMAVSKKTKAFENDIQFICSEEHHLSHVLLLMKPLPGNEFQYMCENLYKRDIGQNAFFYHKSPHSSKTNRIELKTKEEAESKIKSFGVDDDNCQEILTHLGLQKSFT